MSKINTRILKLAKAYCTDKSELEKLMADYPVEAKSDILSFLEINFNDPNFSSLAEAVPLEICGYNSYGPKHGYDGFLGESYDSAYEYAEQKPKKSLIDDDGVVKNQLNGGGGFADYTLTRLERDKLLGDKLVLVISGFANGDLLYVYKVPHNYEKFMGRIEERTIKLIADGKRVLPDFSYIHYKDCEDIDIVWLRNDIENYQKYMSGPFYNWLTTYNKKAV
jgi:hypothetical protein